MNDSVLFSARQASLRFERSLALIFALLGVLLTALIAAHWFLVLEPTLRVEAETRSQALAQAQTRGIEKLFDTDLSPESLSEDIKTALDAILLLKDQSTGEPFIRRIVLILDYDLFDAPQGSFDMARGVERCADCFVARIPIYHPRDHLLIGILTYYTSPRFLQNIVHDVRSKLLWGGGTMLCLIGFAWVGASRLLWRLADSEANLRNVFEATPFPMVLNERGRLGLNQANRAAKAYLDLELDASGQFSSEAWLALYAAGLPVAAGESSEIRIPGPDGDHRWALVSAIPLRFSGVASQLISLVDVSELKAVQEELRAASYTDPLTGLYNRRYLYLTLDREIDLARRYRRSLSIILFDLDHFKRINDTHGHGVGDAVLTKVAATLKACLREVDAAGRYGGEEFLVILPQSGAVEAMKAAERIDAAVKALSWPQDGLRVTLSGGLCEYSHGMAVDAFVEIADQRLYRAKEEGRDRVVG